MRVVLGIVALLLTVAAQAQPPALPAPPPPVPPEYRALYDQIDKALRPLEKRLVRARGPLPIYAAELLPANGNRGYVLLDQHTLATTRIWLDRFAQLGIRGVVFAVPYPLLLRSYPQSKLYVSFYRNVVAEVRRRGMTVEIESAVVFANTPFSSVRWDYSNLTLERLTRERREMISTIIEQIAPDYLDLGAEPDTEARLTGLRELNDPARYADHIAALIKGIDRKKTKIGAGFGTWSNPEFARREAELPIDFIALHIYPVDAQAFANAAEGCRIAREKKKEILLDEAWLYKANPGEVTNIASNAKVFARDAFSFWAPLDQRFLRLISNFARAEKIKLVSPVWSTYFFSYIDYDTGVSQLPYADLVQLVNSTATRSVMNGRFSETGVAYHDLIAGRR